MRDISNPCDIPVSILRLMNPSITRSIHVSVRKDCVYPLELSLIPKSAIF